MSTIETFFIPVFMSILTSFEVKLFQLSVCIRSNIAILKCVDPLLPLVLGLLLPCYIKATYRHSKKYGDAVFTTLKSELSTLHFDIYIYIDFFFKYCCMYIFCLCLYLLFVFLFCFAFSWFYLFPFSQICSRGPWAQRQSYLSTSPRTFPATHSCVKPCWQAPTVMKHCTSTAAVLP